jgi:hypothetical protein
MNNEIKMTISAWIDGVRLRCDLNKTRGSLPFTGLSLSRVIPLKVWQALAVE